MTINEPIAIVGSGCRFAGNSDSPSKLWELLRDPRDVRKAIPDERFSVKGFYHPNGAYHGHANVQHAYLLEDDPSQFDAEFFGIKATEAKSMDPQQRLLMETVYEAIEGAGMTIPGLKGSDTAVFAGLMTNDYGMMLTRDLAHAPTYHATGISPAIVSNRISYFFDWHGPSMTVDTGCSASLVGLHLAVQSLRAGECRMALACGTNLILGPEYFIFESKLKMLSPDGRSKMWDQAANGYARGDGVTAVVLKTLSAAIADGDDIECIIRETGLNQDGATPGITMPSASAQEALIRSTYAKAGLDLRVESDRPQYFEAHGTGTPAGDPIEAEAIRNAFFRDGSSSIRSHTNGNHDNGTHTNGHHVNGSHIDGDLTNGNHTNGNHTNGYHANGHVQEQHPLYVGSIKTVLGHTEGSAGIAAILKASLALQHSTIPPNMLFNQLSDSVAPFYDHLEIATSARPWPQLMPGQVRRASVNSFGFGGANAHAILESYEQPPKKASSGTQLTLPSTFVFSASSEKVLKSTLEGYSAFFTGAPDLRLRDLAHTLRQRRALSQYRVSFAANTITDLSSKIQEHLKVDGNIGVKAFPPLKSGATHRILGVFTGQGAQYARMGAELIEQSAVAQGIIENLEVMLAELPEHDRPEWSLKTEMLADSKSSRVQEATISQPLCTAVQIMLVDLLRLANVEFAAVVGHSSGEIAAAYAAGFLTAREAIYVAYYRGVHLRSAVSPRGLKVRGAMLAVGGSMEEMTQVCDTPFFSGRISVAASNSSSSVTISGDEDAIVELQEILDAEKRFNRRLKVDKAYHSAHMTPCGTRYVRSLERCVRAQQIQAPGSSCQWFSSVHDKLIEPKSGISPTYWAENMANPVLFSQALSRASTETTFDVALEIGAHPALKGPASQTIGEAMETTVPYFGVLRRGTSAAMAFSAALGDLWSRLDPSAISIDGYEKATHGQSESLSVVKGLPGYPWNHSTSYWHEPRASRNLRLRKARVHSLLGDVTTDSTPHHFSWRNLLRIKEMEWLSGHEIQGQPVFPGAGYISSALEAARLIVGEQSIALIELKNFEIHQAVVLPEDDAGVEVLIELVNVSTTRSDRVEAEFTYSASRGANTEDLVLAASASVVIKLGAPSTSLLPEKSIDSQLTHASNVDTESFYSALAEIGYNFSGRFRLLSNLTRKNKKSLSSVTIDASDLDEEGLLLHPTEIDAAFQAILLAQAYPNDEQLRTLHLPTVIRHIRVNPALCANSWEKKESQLVPLEGTLVPGNDGEAAIVGDVNFYSNSSMNAMIQIQGAKLVPFGGGATKADDKDMFSMVHWISSALDGSTSLIDGQPWEKVMKTLERLSAYYLRTFDQQIPIDHPSRSQRPLNFYLEHAKRTTVSIDNDTHGWATKEWATDTLDAILSTAGDVSDLVDVRLMHLVGEQMPRVFRGETTMHDEMRRSNLLGEYYLDGAVIQASEQWIAGITRQLANLNPHMNILEISAGSGEGVVNRFSRHLGNSFLSHTHVNITGSVQKDGTAFFSSPEDPKPTKTFDPVLEPSSQDYVEGSYDLIIAFWVIHATVDMELTLKNLRKLLKPGGRVIIAEGGYNGSGGDGGLNFVFGTLPGWWLGADQGRTLSPYLSTGEWDDLLKTSGFSGIDVSPPQSFSDTFGVSVFVSQAIDNQVSFLRSPIDRLPSSGTLLRDLVVIGGATPRSSHLVKGLRDGLSHYIEAFRSFKTLEDIDNSLIDQHATVVSLTELDKPVFEDMTAETFSAFKQLFVSGKNLLWVTSGRLADQPYSNLTLGFARTALVETPDLRMQQLDLADPQATDPEYIVEKVLRFASVIPESTLWSTESEILVDAGGRELVPRLRPISAYNDRYNSVAREIKQLVDTDTSNVTLQTTVDGYSAKLLTTSRSLTGPSEDLLDLRAVYATPTAIKTVLGHKFLILARDATTASYLALVSSLSSIYSLPYASVVPLNNAKVYDGGFLSQVAANLISIALFDNTYTVGQTVVVHNANESIATALRSEASKKAINLVLTADATNADADESSQRLAPFLTDYEVAQILPREVSLFVGLSDTDTQRWENETTIESYLPSHCCKESASTIHARHGVSNNPLATDDVLRNALNNALQQPRHEVQSVDIERLLRDGVPARPLSTIIDWTASTSLPVQVARSDAQQPFGGDKTYWIIGLSAAIGASLFDWMIEHGAKHLVFSSRRPQLESAWIESHKKNGATIEVVACDITDEASLKSAHATILETMPPIAGVLNGAVLLRDTSIVNMSFDQLNDVLRPKVLGSVYLDRIFYDVPLDFFILTASITGLLGSAGQANYTAANTFLCGLASQRSKRGLAATAINLGAIAGVGLLERADKKVMESIIERLSLMPVSEVDFHQIFAEAIEAGRPNSAFQAPELTTALRAIPVNTPNTPDFFSSPTFSHFLLPESDSQKVSKGSKAAKPIKELLAECETEAGLQVIIKAAFSAEVRKTLQMKMADDDIMAARSGDLGIDSLVSIDLRTWFMKNLKINMPVLKVMSNDPFENLVLFAVDNVPLDLLPSMEGRVANTVNDHANGTNGHTNGVNGHSNGAVEIDWDVETCPPADLAALVPSSLTSTVLDTSVVLLTGVSGLLGAHILTALLEQPSIRKVICVAVRRLEARLAKGELPNDPRVVYYSGDLEVAKLGLSDQDAASIFQEVGAVIHNGADTSHLKSYFDLRPSNLGSTIELVRLCLPRMIPLHVVSSNAVGRYSNKAEIGEVPIYSPGAPKPPTDGASGYRSTKWAVEGLCERVYKSHGLPIWIHRPSTVIRTGKDAEGLAAQLDWMNALIWYMDKLSAVPKLNHVKGFLDLVHTRTVGTGIVSRMLAGETVGGAGKVHYVHHMADLLLPLARLEAFSDGSGRAFRKLPREEWTTEAVAAGMHPAVTVLIEMMDAPGLKGPPMFVKGPGSAHEPDTVST